MSDWKDILKESRLTSRTGIRTKLGTTPLTMGDNDDDDCCELAREKFLEEQANYYDILPDNPRRDARENWILYFEEMLARTDCKTFREILREVGNRHIKRGQNSYEQLKSSIPYSNTLRFWEECENE